MAGARNGDVKRQVDLGGLLATQEQLSLSLDELAQVLKIRFRSVSCGQPRAHWFDSTPGDEKIKRAMLANKCGVRPQSCRLRDPRLGYVGAAARPHIQYPGVFKRADRLSYRSAANAEPLSQASLWREHRARAESSAADALQDLIHYGVGELAAANRTQLESHSLLIHLKATTDEAGRNP